MRLIQAGPKNARIVIVGEAPGATEDSCGVPFSGGSGEVLNKMLGRVGLSRADIFVTNICHVKPPGNEFEWFLKQKPMKDLAYGLVQLKKDLEEIRPNLIIALGARPLSFLTGKSGIEKWRGSVLECTLVKGLKVIGTYHPAFILRIWDYKAVAEMDLRRCAEESTFPEIRRRQREYILNPDRLRLAELVRELSNPNTAWLAEDIECYETPSGWKLACVGFADSADRSVVIPCDEQWKLDAIRELSACQVPKVMQNGTFDETVLGQNEIKVNRFEWDTMLAHHSLYPECASSADEMSALSGKKKQSAIQKGLAFLTSIYTDLPYYKDDGKLWKETGDVDMFYRYNAMDCMATYETREKQERELAEFGTRQVFDMAMGRVHPLMAVTNRGIAIDLELRDKLQKDFTVQIDNLQRVLDAAIGEPVNVKSPKQMQQVLYDQLKLPVKRNRKTGNPTADKDAIVALAEKSNNPVLRIILAIRQRRDFIERYLDARVDADGRMRCSFDITGTRSGRLSSRASIWGSGTNLQNIPARKPEGEAIRRMFVADPGKVFVYRDYSQAEARVVAYLARCHSLIELFEDPSRDIHTENAARIFRKSVDAITPDERYLAKRVVHACNYGMGPDKLVLLVAEDAAATGVRIDYRQATDLITKYFMLYPEIKEVFWKGVERELRYSLTLNTPFGRKRTFFGRWDDKLLREAYSYIPQSTVGDLGAEALVNCYDKIELVTPERQVLLNVHDSILMQCPVGEVEETAEQMAEAMHIPITIHGNTFYIPTDCKVGCNWGSRPKKNPEQNLGGLMDIKAWQEVTPYESTPSP